MLTLARTLPHLARFVYVSTAYVTPHPGNDTPIDESLVSAAGSRGRVV